MRILLPVALACAAIGSAAADDADDVRCSEIDFSLAAEARDAERFASYIDDDARFVGRIILRGPQAVVEDWAPFFAPDGPSIKWRPRMVDVLADGQLALSRGPYEITARNDEGGESRRYGTYNSVWRRQDDGGWKVLIDFGSPSTESADDDTLALLSADEDCA